MKHQAQQRAAIAMIELIFAIVVMGIVMMSAPMLISTSVQSTNVALQQEGISEAATRVNILLTYPWDENNTIGSCISPVLHVTAGDSELDEATNRRRIGVDVNSSSRTFDCDGSEFNASVIGSDGGDKDDLDDFGNANLAEVIDLTTGVDYIEQGTVSIATGVRYVNDNANYDYQTFSYALPLSGTSAGTTNIKAIDVTLTSSSGVNELAKTIVLHAFSCNIGSFDFAKKEF